MDHEAQQEFLHEERSAMESYLMNFNLSKKEKKEQQSFAKKLAELMKLKTKLDVLNIEKNNIQQTREMFKLVGLNEKPLKAQWIKKHEQYMKGCKQYNEKKKLYEKL